MQIVEGFQAQFILSNLTHLATSLLVIAAALFARPTWVLVTRPPGVDTAATAATFLLMHALVWPTLLAILLVSALNLTITTHKVAGPLVRFRRVFQQMADGRFRGPVTLRDGDYLKAEAALLSSALATLEQRDALCLTALRHAESALAQASVARHPAALTDALASATRQVAAARALLPDPAADAVQKAPLRLVPGAEAHTGTLHRRGFTLVETLIVLALITVVSAMAYPQYADALYAARVARAIGDINGIGKEISVFQVLNGRLPVDLSEIERDQNLDPWGHPYEYLPLDGSVNVASSWGQGPAPRPMATGGGKDKPAGNDGRNGGDNGGGGNGGGAKARARKDRNLHPLNADFDLYSRGRDGESALPLTAKASHDDIIRASNGGFVGLATNF